MDSLKITEEENQSLKKRITKLEIENMNLKEENKGLKLEKLRRKQNKIKSRKEFNERQNRFFPNGRNDRIEKRLAHLEKKNRISEQKKRRIDIKRF